MSQIYFVMFIVKTICMTLLIASLLFPIFSKNMTVLPVFPVSYSETGCKITSFFIPSKSFLKNFSENFFSPFFRFKTHLQMSFSFAVELTSGLKNKGCKDTYRFHSGNYISKYFFIFYPLLSLSSNYNGSPWVTGSTFPLKTRHPPNENPAIKLEICPESAPFCPGNAFSSIGV